MERDYLEGLSGDGMILKYILKKCDGEVWTRLLFLKTHTVGGLL